VKVSDLVRPVYEDIYPQQKIPLKAREAPDVSDKKAAADPKRFEAESEQDDYSFKANYEMMGNVFRSGISRNSAKFKNQETFPHDEDRYQKPIRAFTVTKLYDSELNRFKTDADIEAERHLSHRKQALKSQLDMNVKFGFTVN